MTTPSVPTVRVRAPAEILAAVPYLLGFHPSDSLVLIGLRGKRLAFNARGDLPPTDAPAADVAQLAHYYAATLLAQRLTRAVLVGYGAEDRVTPVLMQTRDVLVAKGVKVLEALRATDGRYWSYVCGNPACCPPDGTPYDVLGSTVAAEATMAGFVALPDRAAVVRSLDPPSGLALAAVAQATERAQERFVAMFGQEDGAAALVTAGEVAVAQACERYAADGRLTDDELAWLSVLLALTPVRDLAWRRIDAAGAGRSVHERLWTDVLRRCEPMLAAAPGMLLSYTLWRNGDGLRAGVAVERALAADPTYSAARLMLEVLTRAVPPSALDRHREGHANPPRRGRSERHRQRRQPKPSRSRAHVRHRRRR
jgi:hypothetical protein